VSNRAGKDVRALARPNCPVCACPIEADTPDDPLEICPRCRTPHHHDCWEYNGGCAVYACRDAEPPDEIEIESWPEVLQDYMTWLQLTRFSRRAALVFVVSCLITAHLAFLGSYAGVGPLTILLALLPMVFSGTAFALVQRQVLTLQSRLEAVTGDEPFTGAVSARDAARWLLGAREAVGGLDWRRYLHYGWVGAVTTALLLPLASSLPAGALAFLAVFDCFALFMVGDSFRGMRREQAILIERFKATFQPRLTEGTKKASPTGLDDIDVDALP